MLPISEEFEGKRPTPFVTAALILVMLGVTLALSGPDRASMADDLRSTWGMVPSRLSADWFLALPTLFTYMFLHAGFLHLGTNLLFLWVFGPGIEREFGWAYLPFFLVAGAVAGLASALTREGSNVGTIGASGAISGLLGAYLVLQPNSTIRSLVMFPIFWVFNMLRGERITWEVPAWTVIITWVVVQVAESLAPRTSGVDHAAHIGGFLFGYVLIRVMRAWFGFWPDESPRERILDRPSAFGQKLPNTYVRAIRRIAAGVPIVIEDVEWVTRRSGDYVDPGAVPGSDRQSLIGRRLREPRFRYEPVRWDDLEPVESEIAAAPSPKS